MMIGNTKSRAAMKLAAVLVLATTQSVCENPVSSDPHEHGDVQGVVITDLSGTVIADTHGSHWHFAEGDAIHMHPGETAEVRIWFVDSEGERFQVINDPEYTLVVDITHPSIVSYESHGDHGDLSALAPGGTTATIHYWHGAPPGGHPDYSSPVLTIEVVDHAH